MKTKISPSSEVTETPIFFEKAEEVTETTEWKELTFDIIRNIRDPGFLKYFFEIWGCGTEIWRKV